MKAALRPGGRLVLEDIDYRGSFCYPDSDVFRRGNEIYEQTALRNGGDPFIGVKLPGLLLDAGFERVQPSIAHPVGLEGDVKLLPPLTIENIKAMAVKHDVATAEEVDTVVDGLTPSPATRRCWSPSRTSCRSGARRPDSAVEPRAAVTLPPFPTGERWLAHRWSHSSPSAASSHSDSTASRWAVTSSSWAASSASRS